MRETLQETPLTLMRYLGMEEYSQFESDPESRLRDETVALTSVYGGIVESVGYMKIPVVVVTLGEAPYRSQIEILRNVGFRQEKDAPFMEIVRAAGQGEV